jgi:hypothetical protein
MQSSLATPAHVSALFQLVRLSKNRVHQAQMQLNEQRLAMLCAQQKVQNRQTQIEQQQLKIDAHVREHTKRLSNKNATDWLSLLGCNQAFLQLQNEQLERQKDALIDDQNDFFDCQNQWAKSQKNWLKARAHQENLTAAFKRSKNTQRVRQQNQIENEADEMKSGPILLKVPS